MARHATVNAKPPKTAESSRSLLIARGCEAIWLDFYSGWVIQARRGEAPFFPTRTVDVFARADGRRLDRLEKEILGLANVLSGLWTERGTSFLRTTIKQHWMLELPNLLNQYSMELKTIRRAMDPRRPANLDLLKSALVEYVRGATGERNGWHDAELALLCAEERRAWAKWRKGHSRPLPKPEPASPSDSMMPIGPLRLC
jgi:hypothetical protein